MALLSWIVLILVLVLCSIIGVRVFAGVFGRGEALPPMPPTEEVKEANRRAVAEGNYGDIELEVVQRGYRMDQVDALIAQLTGQEEVAPDAETWTQVESTATVSTDEGALTHGSDETANR